MQVAAEEQSAEPTIALEAAAAEALQSEEQTVMAQAARISALERELAEALQRALNAEQSLADRQARTVRAAAADDEGPDKEGSRGLAAWLAAKKCEACMKQLEAEEGLKELDDLLPLLCDSDKTLVERLAALGMKPAEPSDSSWRSAPTRR